MLPKKLRSVVARRRRNPDGAESDLDLGPPAKRIRSSDAKPEIIMMINQLIRSHSSKKNNKDKKGKNTVPKSNQAHPRAQEASVSHNSVLIAHPKLGCNTPAVLVLFQGSISNNCISPSHFGGPGAHPYLCHLGPGTCQTQGLSINCQVMASRYRCNSSSNHKVCLLVLIQSDPQFQTNIPLMGCQTLHPLISKDSGVAVAVLCSTILQQAAHPVWDLIMVQKMMSQTHWSMRCHFQ